MRQQVAFNVTGDGLARAGAVDALRVMLGEARAAILADPAWMAAFGRGLAEALAPGVDGWLDEALVINGEWPDVDLGAVTSSVTW